ncbi:DoxX family protein [Flavobacteriaceae bacterium]|nr:DoxX family protein [Flavobacteriaceae bacterium]MDA9015489.1 DoxX family protein [Flavobacteriaceae bacterium]MDB3862473.1 DoxX family protein [Flavobacteriaceae bacterium]MDC3354185.1 DoxX family protein [Flavobacteriaceae bacterium]
MKILKQILSAAISIVVLNVWFFRFNQSTIYRGGKASNMIEEFAVYGLNETMAYIIGGLKVLAALGLLIGFFKDKIVIPSAGLMAVLMLGALFMHFRVDDEAIKYLPAGIMFAFSVTVFLIQSKANRLAH